MDEMNLSQYVLYLRNMFDAKEKYLEKSPGRYDNFLFYCEFKVRGYDKNLRFSYQLSGSKSDICLHFTMQSMKAVSHQMAKFEAKGPKIKKLIDKFHDFESLINDYKMELQ